LNHGISRFIPRHKAFFAGLFKSYPCTDWIRIVIMVAAARMLLS
jgi:hypothetical protein